METNLGKAAFIICALVFSFTASRSSASVSTSELIDGATLSPVTLESVIQQVKPGGVFIISEQHGNLVHYEHQREALSALANMGRCTLSVGLEFLMWPYQQFNAPYLAGQISEADFLTNAKWPANPFADYRDQARFPKQTGGELVSINAPSELVKAISQNGIAALQPELKRLMPPSFELGSANYRERFDSVMAAHVPPAALNRYFEAQSVWDETMAWQILDFLNQHPTHCIAVIVGDFHAAWGGGLPDRLRARGAANVTVISQFDVTGLTPMEKATELGPHPQYGVRADAIWLNEAAIPSAP